MKQRITSLSLLVMALGIGLWLGFGFCKPKPPLSKAQQIMQRHLAAVSPVPNEVIEIAAHFDSPDTNAFAYSGRLWWHRKSGKSKAELQLRIDAEESRMVIFKDNFHVIEYDCQTAKTTQDALDTGIWFTDWFDVWAEQNWLSLTVNYKGRKKIDSMTTEVIEIINPRKGIPKITNYYDVKTGLRARSEFKDYNMGQVDFKDYQIQKIGLYPKCIVLENNHKILINSILINKEKIILEFNGKIS